MKPLAVMALTAAFGLPAGADELRYDPQVLTDCLRDAAQADLCPGKAAKACMAAEEAAHYGPIVALCSSAETRQWDGLIAEAEASLAAETDDVKLDSGQSALLPASEYLKIQGRSWAAFHEAATEYERVRWLGGSGEGPEVARRDLELTAAYAIWLMRGAGQLKERP